MLSEILRGEKFFSLLHRIDLDLAEEVRSRGCPFCPGPLHRGEYARKPRGGPASLPEQLLIRHSLCCGREGCRRRTLPPSVLFLGRRVYWGAVVLVASALLQGRAGHTARKVAAMFGTSLLTIKRWRAFFLLAFPQSATWQKLRGLLMPPVAAEEIPLAVLERLGLNRDGPETALLGCLRLLAGCGL